ncbi:MAG: hypothetical protein PHY45_01000 [Rhodocyclaceae bacterium]|nr:hypothetical protein [Rhodocyclaceae bacterium]
MSNALYDKGREAFLTGSISFSSDTIKVVLLDLTHYTANLATDQFLSDIPSAARVYTSTALASKTTTAGVANAANLTLTAVSGATCGALAMFKDTGSATTSPLIAYIDTATGLPVTPSGSDIPIIWDTGSNHIFKL